MKRIFTLLVIALIGSGSLFAQSIQFIDNIADPNVDTVNIYFVWTATAGGGGGSGEVADSVIGATFRTASAFNSVTGDGWIYTVYMVPSGAGGAGATSADTASGTILGTVGPINNSSNYAVIASGLSLIESSIFAPNPNGVATTYSLSVDSSALIHSTDSARTAFAFFNGIPDATTLLVNSNGETSINSAFPPGNLFAGAAYGSFSSTSYVDLADENYFFSLFDVYSNSYGYYIIKLNGAADSAGIIFTSGFVDSIDVANGGAPFGLFIATSGGEIFPLTAVYPSFVQVIDNSPDTSIPEVEVTIAEASSGTIFNSQVLAFGTSISGVNPATPYLPVIAEDSVVIAFGPAGDTSLADAFAVFGISPLYPGSFSVYIADGVLPSDSANYPSNPEGNSTVFSLYSHAGIAQDTVPHTASLLFFQGVPDDSAINVTEILSDTTVVDTTLVSAIQYGQYQGYQNLDSASYVIEVTDSAGSIVFQKYLAPLNLAIGAGAVVYSSGFIDSSLKVPFALIGTFPTGTTLALPVYIPTGINTVPVLNNIELSPNPSSTNARLSFTLANATNVQYSMINMLGQQMQYQDLGNLNAGTTSVDIDVASLSNGTYLLNLTLNNNTHVTRTIVVNR